MFGPAETTALVGRTKEYTEQLNRGALTVDQALEQTNVLQSDFDKLGKPASAKGLLDDFKRGVYSRYWESIMMKLGEEAKDCTLTNLYWIRRVPVPKGEESRFAASMTKLKEKYFDRHLKVKVSNWSVGPLPAGWKETMDTIKLYHLTACFLDAYFLKPKVHPPNNWDQILKYAEKIKMHDLDLLYDADFSRMKQAHIQTILSDAKATDEDRARLCFALLEKQKRGQVVYFSRFFIERYGMRGEEPWIHPFVTAMVRKTGNSPATTDAEKRAIQGVYDRFVTVPDKLAKMNKLETLLDESEEYEAQPKEHPNDPIEYALARGAPFLSHDQVLAKLDEIKTLRECILNDCNVRIRKNPEDGRWYVDMPGSKVPEPGGSAHRTRGASTPALVSAASKPAATKPKVTKPGTRGWIGGLAAGSKDAYSRFKAERKPTMKDALRKSTVPTKKISYVAGSEEEEEESSDEDAPKPAPKPKSTMRSFRVVKPNGFNPSGQPLQRVDRYVEAGAPTLVSDDEDDVPVARPSVVGEYTPAELQQQKLLDLHQAFPRPNSEDEDEDEAEWDELYAYRGLGGSDDEEGGAPNVDELEDRLYGLRRSNVPSNQAPDGTRVQKAGYFEPQAPTESAGLVASQQPVWQYNPSTRQKEYAEENPDSGLVDVYRPSPSGKEFVRNEKLSGFEGGEWTYNTVSKRDQKFVMINGVRHLVMRDPKTKECFIVQQTVGLGNIMGRYEPREEDVAPRQDSDSSDSEGEEARPPSLTPYAEPYVDPTPKTWEQVLAKYRQSGMHAAEHVHIEGKHPDEIRSFYAILDPRANSIFWYTYMWIHPKGDMYIQIDPPGVFKDGIDSAIIPRKRLADMRQKLGLDPGEPYEGTVPAPASISASSPYPDAEDATPNQEESSSDEEEEELRSFQRNIPATDRRPDQAYDMRFEEGVERRVLNDQTGRMNVYEVKGNTEVFLHSEHAHGEPDDQWVANERLKCRERYSQDAETGKRTVLLDFGDKNGIMCMFDNESDGAIDHDVLWRRVYNPATGRIHLYTYLPNGLFGFARSEHASGEPDETWVKNRVTESEESYEEVDGVRMRLIRSPGDTEDTGIPHTRVMDKEYEEEEDVPGNI